MRKRLLYCLTIITSMAISGKVSSQSMVIESLTGPFTQKELNAFKANMKNQGLPNGNKGNGLVYGGPGKNMEAMGQMYEITGDIDILNKLIQCADNALASRNDLVLGKKDTIWTGNIDPVWPNYTAASPRGWQYSGTENGDVIAHIAYCAQSILEHPELWNQTVPVGDTYGFGSTYLDRAKKYVNECLYTMESFIIPYIVRSNFQLQYPSDSRYKLIDDRHDKDSGGNAPWNQQAMLTGGFMRLARCMELLNISPDKVAYYDKIVKTSADWFIKELQRYEQNGKYYYKWSYAAGDTKLKYMEDVGHGGYDIIGITRAYMSGKYGVPNEVMVGLANTLADIIMEPFPETQRFKSYVDGLKDSGSTTARIGATYFYLCPFRSDLFEPLGSFHIGDRGLGDPLIISCILWLKDKNLKNVWNAMDSRVVPIPGTIEAERYNLGGEGSGYHDLTAGNSGKLYRNDDVDIEKTSDATGAYVVATNSGEWMNYTVVASANDKYSFNLRVASATPGILQVLVDGSIVGTVNVPNTGGAQKWTTVSLNNVSINSGTREFKLVSQSNGIYINYINIVKGEVISNVAPIVNIIAPTNNTTFTAPASVTINANATDSDGSIAKVEFYNGSTLLSSDNSSPYSFTWTNVGSGIYSITAKATDNGGASTISAAVKVTVNTVSANNCIGIPQYKENGGYVDGSKVQNTGVIFQCKPYPYTGWCNGAAWAYAPGTGTYWTDAWDKVGTCTPRLGSADELNNSIKISILPNPTSQFAQVKLNVEDIVSADYSLLNSLGVEVLNGKITNSLECAIDLTCMQNGIYTIRISSEGNVWMSKIIKQ